jgi:putative membrane protein
MSELNDPRVFFAAERTLLAWNRTSLTLMAFGFMIERFNLFTHMLALHPDTSMEKNFSYWVGLSFILLGALAAAASALQYRRLLPSFKPSEIPDSYRVEYRYRLAGCGTDAASVSPGTGLTFLTIEV